MDETRRTPDRHWRTMAPVAALLVTLTLGALMGGALGHLQTGTTRSANDATLLTVSIALGILLTVVVGAWAGTVLLRALRDESTARRALEARGADLEAMGRDLAERTTVAERARDDARNLVEQMSDAFVSVDATGRVLFANSAAAHLAARPASDLVGQPIWSSIAPSLESYFAPGAAAGTRASRLGVRETQIDDEATGRQFLMRSHPTDTGWSVVLQDLTEQRTTERALLATQRAFRRLARSNVIGVVTLAGADERVVDANEAAASCFGWTREAIRQKTLQWSATVPVSGPDEAPTEVDAIRTDGTHVPILTVGAGIDDGSGTRVVLVMDLTASRRASAQIHAFEDRLGQLYRSGLVGIATLDPSGAIRDANDALLALLGYPAGALPDGGLSAESIGLDRGALAHTEGTGPVPPPAETTLRRADGSLVPVLVSGAPLAGAGGGAALVVLDRTARAEADVERERLWALAETARAAAEQANDAKMLFLASMSHELRTPLNAIFGFAEMLEMGVRGPVTPTQQRDLQRIQHNGKQLLGRIDDILNYSGFDPVTLKDAAMPVGVDDLVRPLVEQLTAAAAPHDVVVTPPDIPPGLAAVADTAAVTTVLENLIGNALKFTPMGGRIDLRVATTADRVMIHVVDSGPGLRPDDLERVFVPFTQALAPDGTGGERRPPGMGLGLALSRRLARGMNGDVTAVSEPGTVGAHFILTLPRAADLIG